jgi:integrase
VTRLSTKGIYYKKAFENARRCLKEALTNNNPAGKQIISLKNSANNEFESVMKVELAIDWCIENHLPDWSQSTWRMHRCGYRLLLELLVAKGHIDAGVAAGLNERMLGVFGLKRGERTKKTSSRRKKSVSQAHIDLIVDLVTSRECKWGSALVVWLNAAVATGLRPNEWLTAEILNDNGRIVLKSENFKHNETRSYGTHRFIDLTDIELVQLEFVKKQVSVATGMAKAGMAHSYYQGCSSLLYWCNQMLWPHRKANLTLYTGRHQFSANAKADAGVSEIERAALMGHKTTKTSRERYGRSASGSVGLTPTVADPSVLSLIVDTPQKDSHKLLVRQK